VNRIKIGFAGIPSGPNFQSSQWVEISFFLCRKEQAVFTLHNTANFSIRVAPANKSHTMAAVRKNWIPGDIIINALVAIDGHVSFGVLA